MKRGRNHRLEAPAFFMLVCHREPDEPGMAIWIGLQSHPRGWMAGALVDKQGGMSSSQLLTPPRLRGISSNLLRLLQFLDVPFGVFLVFATGPNFELIGFVVGVIEHPHVVRIGVGI